MTSSSHIKSDCLAPNATHPPQKFRLPRGAWDTHAHVISNGIRPPFVQQRGYTPPQASADQFITTINTVGIDFGVLVQISVHGTDNSLILDAIKQHPTRF